MPQSDLGILEGPSPKAPNNKQRSLSLKNYSTLLDRDTDIDIDVDRVDSKMLEYGFRMI